LFRYDWSTPVQTNYVVRPLQQEPATQEASVHPRERSIRRNLLKYNIFCHSPPPGAAGDSNDGHESPNPPRPACTGGWLAHASLTRVRGHDLQDHGLEIGPRADLSGTTKMEEQELNEFSAFQTITFQHPSPLGLKAKLGLSN
ncbi:MAG: hypothetical protein ACP5XB_09200, partial [Isosphaeraceae bacterium]